MATNAERPGNTQEGSTYHDRGRAALIGAGVVLGSMLGFALWKMHQDHENKKQIRAPTPHRANLGESVRVLSTNGAKR